MRSRKRAPTVRPPRRWRRGTAPTAIPGSGGDPASPTSAAPADDSGVAEVVGDLASGSDDGMGIVLPIVLAVAALAAIAFFAARRSRGRTGNT